MSFTKSAASILSAFILTLTLTSSCVKHKLCDNCEEPPVVDTIVDYNLIIKFNHINIDTLYNQHFNILMSGGGAKSSTYVMQAIVDVYLDDGSAQPQQPIKRIKHDLSRFSGGPNEEHIPIELAMRKYKLVVWVGHKDSPYYNTDNLAAIRITPSPDAEPVLTPKYAYTGVMNVDAVQADINHINTIVMDLETPLANYMIITSDVAKFKSKEDKVLNPNTLRTKLAYSLWLPYGYNAITQEINYLQENAVTYTDVVPINADSAIIATDYIFLDKRTSLAQQGDTPESLVNVNFVIYDRLSLDIINGLSGLDIPLRMGWLTIVSGEFLTQEYNFGGIGIDDNFDGEIVIILPD
jgi:hypothetical protein